MCVFACSCECKYMCGRPDSDTACGCAYTCMYVCVLQTMLPVDESLAESMMVRIKYASLCRDTLLRSGTRHCRPGLRTSCGAFKDFLLVRQAVVQGSWMNVNTSIFALEYIALI